MSTILEAAACTIFAHYFMEDVHMITEFRSRIIQTEDADDDYITNSSNDDNTINNNEEEPRPSKHDLLQAANHSALWSVMMAFLALILLAVPMFFVSSNKLSKEGRASLHAISNIFAAISFLILSIKISKWLGFYNNKKNHSNNNDHSSLDETENDLIDAETVSWNIDSMIWRQKAECFLLLLPSFLAGESLLTIGTSAIVGVMFGWAFGYFIYWSNHTSTMISNRKLPLAIGINAVLIFLSSVFFVVGHRELEHLYAKTVDKDVTFVMGDILMDEEGTILMVPEYEDDGIHWNDLYVFRSYLWFTLCIVVHGILVLRAEFLNQLPKNDRQRGQGEDMESVGEVATVIDEDNFFDDVNEDEVDEENVVIDHQVLEVMSTTDRIICIDSKIQTTTSLEV